MINSGNRIEIRYVLERGFTVIPIEGFSILPFSERNNSRHILDIIQLLIEFRGIFCLDDFKSRWIKKPQNLLENMIAEGVGLNGLFNPKSSIKWIENDNWFQIDFDAELKPQLSLSETLHNFWVELVDVTSEYGLNHPFADGQWLFDLNEDLFDQYSNELAEKYLGGVKGIVRAGIGKNRHIHIAGEGFETTHTAARIGYALNNPEDFDLDKGIDLSPVLEEPIPIKEISKFLLTEPRGEGVKCLIGPALYLQIALAKIDVWERKYYVVIENVLEGISEENLPKTIAYYNRVASESKGKIIIWGCTSRNLEGHKGIE